MNLKFKVGASDEKSFLWRSENLTYDDLTRTDDY